MTPNKRMAAIVRVADGAGGMRTVADHRFDTATWPVSLTIEPENAESFLAVEPPRDGKRYV